MNKRNYKKPEILSEKLDLNLLHTTCSGGNEGGGWEDGTWLPPDNAYGWPPCEPCEEQPVAFTNHEDA